MNPFSRNAVAAGAVVMLAACAPAAPVDVPASPPPAGACNPALLDSLKGLSLADASAKLDQAGVRHRVVRDGDKNFPVTLDFDHQRVGLELKDGVVTAASCG